MEERRCAACGADLRDLIAPAEQDGVPIIQYPGSDVDALITSHRHNKFDRIVEV